MRVSIIASILFVCLAGTASAKISESYTDVKNVMSDLAQKYPSNVQKFELGASDSGETILGLKIGSGPLKNLLVATHHGNEYGSTEVALGFAKSIAENPIKGQTLYVIPVLNIGGYNDHNRYEMGAGSSRDPNRDYPGPCGTEGPFKLKSTHALANFVDKEGIVTSATLHTYYPAVAYPWGISSQDLKTPYEEFFKTFTALAAQESHYATGNSTELIYPADGTYEDYTFWKHGMWSILFELGYSHDPSQSDVDTLLAVNVPGLRRMFENSPQQRAENHAFTGKCDVRMKSRDRHDE